MVRRELHRYRDQTGHDVVERQDLLDQSRSVLEAEFPEANTPGQTLSRVLQELRDSDELEFLDHAGTYRIRELEVDAADVSTDQGTGTYEAETYETTVQARSMPAAFREAVLSWYDARCPVSGVDHAGLLDVAHVLPWSDYPDRRTDPANVIPLDKTHHEAFDRGLFTLDSGFHLHVSPELSTDSDVLRRTLLDREGNRVEFPDVRQPSGEYLNQHNSRLDWW